MKKPPKFYFMVNLTTDIFPHQEETNRQQFYDEMMKTAVCLPSYRFPCLSPKKWKLNLKKPQYKPSGAFFLSIY